MTPTTLIRCAYRCADGALLAPVAGFIAAIAGTPVKATALVTIAAIAALTCGWWAFDKAAYLLRDRLDADLNAVPYGQAVEMAHTLYARHASPMNCPADFERSARVLIARGRLELPYNARI